MVRCRRRDRCSGGGFVAGGIGGESSELGAESFLPAGAAKWVESGGEEAIGFEPHLSIAMPIEAVREGAGFVFAGEEVTVREDGGGENRVGEVRPAGARFQL